MYYSRVDLFTVFRRAARTLELDLEIEHVARGFAWGASLCVILLCAYCLREQFATPRTLGRRLDPRVTMVPDATELRRRQALLQVEIARLRSDFAQQLDALLAQTERLTAVVQGATDQQQGKKALKPGGRKAFQPRESVL